MKSADSILLYTDKEIEMFKAGWNGPRLFAANNTLDISDIEEERSWWSNKRLREFRASMGLGDAKLLLFCSRLSKTKQLDLLLRALRQLASHDKDYRLAVIGDGPERHSLESLADSLGIGERVLWPGC